MRKRLLCLLLAFSFVIGMMFSFAGCEGNGENVTEVPSVNETDAPTSDSKDETTEPDDSDDTEAGESTEAETDAETDVDTDAATEADTANDIEIVTDADIEGIVFENGNIVMGAGDELEEDAFALKEHTVDESKAKVISSADFLAKLKEENGLQSGDVYTLSDKLVISSSGKYLGNGACVIAPYGVEINGVTDVTVDGLTIKGDLSLVSAKEIQLQNIDVKGNAVAINVDGGSADVFLKDCRITASDTAVKSSGDDVAVYRSFLCADTAVVSTGDRLTVQDCRIVALSLAVSSSGVSPIVRENTVEVGVEGVGIDLAEGSYNGLVALNVVKNAQLSIRVVGGFNCSVVVNNAVNVIGENNTNLYVVDNKLGGYIKLVNNKYLICDGNVFPNDNKPHAVINRDNSEYNGDGLHDVNARPGIGANEELLPHTNKELFMGMERNQYVRNVTTESAQTFQQFVKDELSKNYGSVIVPPGVYSVSSSLTLSNITKHSYTSIYAYGVYQEADYLNYVIYFDGVSGIELKGLTMGYTNVSSGQSHVVSKLQDNKVLVVPAAGYPADSYGSGDLFAAGHLEPWSTMPNKGIVKNQDGTMTITLDSLQTYNKVGVGDIATSRLGSNNKFSIGVTGSHDIYFQDCVLYGYSEALAVRLSGVTTENVTLERFHNTVHAPYEITKEEYDKYVAWEEKYDVDLEVYIDEQGRYRGATPRVGSVDATHVISTGEGLNAVSCLFESMCDDGSNQRGSSARLHGVKDNKDGTTTLYYKGYVSQTYYEIALRDGVTEKSENPVSFKKGDKILVYTSNGKVLCDTVCLSASLFTGETLKFGSDIGLKVEYSNAVYQVVVATDALNLAVLDGYDLSDNHYKMDNKVIVDNTSAASSGFDFDNVVVQNIRSRGILVKTTDATIKHCTFRNLAMTGNLLSPEYSWGESTVARNVYIYKCLFDNTGFQHDDFTNTNIAPISISSRATEVGDFNLPIDNITIEGCKFTNNKNRYAIHVNSAQNVRIINNIFDPIVGEAAPSRLGVSININVAKNVEISGNTFSPNAAGNIQKVIKAKEYINIYGTDVTKENGEKIFK